METIDQMISWLLVFIPLGGTARILYCLAAMSADSDARDSFQKRIKNILIFIVVAEILSGLLKLIAHYYGG
ncbi:MAG: hypothetical protein AAGU02_02750 [Lawsonibacter sp.]